MINPVKCFVNCICLYRRDNGSLAYVVRCASLLVLGPSAARPTDSYREGIQKTGTYRCSGWFVSKCGSFLITVAVFHCVNMFQLGCLKKWSNQSKLHTPNRRESPNPFVIFEISYDEVLLLYHGNMGHVSLEWQQPIRKIHPCASDVIPELEHRSLCGRNETRTVNLEEQSEKSARAKSERTENPVGDTNGSVRRSTGMETFHDYYVS